MSARPKQRSSIARRAFLAALIGQLVLLAGLSALLYWAYLTLESLLWSIWRPRPAEELVAREV